MPDTVHRLRLRGPADRDAVARRHRAEAAVAGGLPVPRGLPAGALLCVRRLTLPLPRGALATVARQAAPVLRRQLDEAWAQAVRPAAASPGAAVPALWFADEAELLVFLARRAAAGDTAAWWWPALVRRGPTAWGAVAAAWLERPQAVPAAVVVLGSDAERVCRAMGDAICDAMAQAVAAVFGVRGWGRAAEGEPLPMEGQVCRTHRAAASEVAGGEGVRQRAEEPAGSDRLERMKAAATPAAQATPRRPFSRAQRLMVLSRALHREPWRASSLDFAAGVDRAAGGWWEGVEPRAEWVGKAEAPMGGDSKPGSWPIAAEPVGQVAVMPRVAPQPGMPRVPGPLDRPGVDAPRLARLPPQAPVPVPRCITPHAGLFFLVPLLLQRGLYADFTQPAHAGLALHPAWLLQELLQLLQRRRGSGSADDPLPGLLQAWAGMPRRPRGPTPWRPWLAALQRQLQADAAARLARPARGALAWLVRRPGWVQLNASRIDIGFSLEDHPLAIRAAGLDRDPGWLPAGGRHIAFHFHTAANEA